MAESTETPRAVPVPRGWVPQFLVGTAVLLALLIGGLIATDHAVGKLVGDLRAGALSGCTGRAAADCRATYPATVVGVRHGDTTRVALATDFLADTAQDDQCFGTKCFDTVRLRDSDGGDLQKGDQATINAGKGRIYSITATDGTTWSTYDSPEISLLNTASSLIWTLYLDAFAVSWLAAYLFMVLALRVWRITATTFRRGLNIVTITATLGSIITFVAYVLGGVQSFVLLAVGLLLSAGAGALARRHPETQVSSAKFVPNSHWRKAMQRGLTDGFYLLAAFPLPLGLAVAFLLAHDEGMSVGPFIAAAVGIAAAAFLVSRMRRKLNGSPGTR